MNDFELASLRMGGVRVLCPCLSRAYNVRGESKDVRVGDAACSDISNSSGVAISLS